MRVCRLIFWGSITLLGGQSMWAMDKVVIPFIKAGDIAGLKAAVSTISNYESSEWRILDFLFHAKNISSETRAAMFALLLAQLNFNPNVSIRGKRIIEYLIKSLKYNPQDLVLVLLRCNRYDIQYRHNGIVYSTSLHEFLKQLVDEKFNKYLFRGCESRVPWSQLPDPNVIDSDKSKNTLLHTLISGDFSKTQASTFTSNPEDARVSIAGQLLQNPAINVNLKNKDNRTPLASALFHKRHAIAQLLVNRSDSIVDLHDVMQVLASKDYALAAQFISKAQVTANQLPEDRVIDLIRDSRDTKDTNRGQSAHQALTALNLSESEQQQIIDTHPQIEELCPHRSVHVKIAECYNRYRIPVITEVCLGFVCVCMVYCMYQGLKGVQDEQEEAEDTAGAEVLSVDAIEQGVVE